MRRLHADVGHAGGGRRAETGQRQLEAEGAGGGHDADPVEDGQAPVDLDPPCLDIDRLVIELDAEGAFGASQEARDLLLGDRP